MSKPKLYIAGPMRGYPEFNFPAFRRAAVRLGREGFEVFSPAARDEKGGFDPSGLSGTMDELAELNFDLRAALGADTAWICAFGEGIAVLPGWAGSSGARAEVALALALGLPVAPVDAWAGWYDEHRLGRQPGFTDALITSVTNVVDPPVPTLTVVRDVLPAEGYLRSQQGAVGSITHMPDPYQAGKDRAIERDLASSLAQRHDEVLAAAEAAGFPLTTDTPLTPYGQAERDVKELSDRLWGKVTVRPGTLLRHPHADHPEEVRVTNELTGGQKGSKLARYDLIPAGPLRSLAELYGKGAEKYADRNWEKGYAWSLSFAALNRHLWQWWNGEDVDAEMLSCHLTNVAWHAFALLEWMTTRTELDDRPNTTTEAS